MCIAFGCIGQRWAAQVQMTKKREVPGQLAHDLRIGYSLNNGRYNIGAEIRNIADAQLYDNFGLQKPGRSFAVNLRYYFQQVK